jgi:Tfp pilus assembly protein PilF
MLGAGCGAAVRPPAPVGTAGALLAAAEAKGLPAEDPLAMDAEMAADVERHVGGDGTPTWRMRDILRYVNHLGEDGFKYEPRLTLTAREAFRQQRGDCMSYAHLFIAMARHMGLPVYFVYVREVAGLYRQGDSLYISSHVAVGYGQGPSAVVMDIAKEAPYWSLSLYNAIDDGTALALYYNNLAVDAMISGRMEQAEQMMRFWLSVRPNVAELYNNLGVLLNRQRRHGEALAVLERGIAMFPRYEPLYANAVQAARRSGDTKRADALLRRAADVGDSDPLLLLSLGLSLYQAGNYEGAAERLEKARDAMPDSPVLSAWLTRVYLAARRYDDGQSAFQDVHRLAPGSKLEKDLLREFPDRLHR